MNDPVFLVLRQYACLAHPNSIEFPANISKSAFQSFLVKSILQSDHFTSYPPSLQYQRSFWKRIISQLESRLTEDEDFEISPDIYDHYLRLLNPWSNGYSSSPVIGHEPPSRSFTTYFWKASRGLSDYQRTTILESRSTIESGTTGLTTWTASFVLSQHLINNPDLVVDRKVLELGSGIGLSGIITRSMQKLNESTKCTSGRVWLTDVNRTVLATCRDNVELPCNMSFSDRTKVSIRELDWFAALDSARRPALISLVQEEINPDIIIGADIVYDPSLVAPLIATMEIVMPSNAPTSALFALTKRNESTLDTFMKDVKGLGYKVEKVADATTDPVSFIHIPGLDRNLKEVTLFRFSRSRV